MCVSCTFAVLCSIRWLWRILKSCWLSVCVCTDVCFLFSYSSILHARRHNSQQVCRHRITGQQLSEHPAADTGTGPRVCSDGSTVHPGSPSSPFLCSTFTQHHCVFVFLTEIQGGCLFSTYCWLVSLTFCSYPLLNFTSFAVCCLYVVRVVSLIDVCFLHFKILCHDAPLSFRPAWDLCCLGQTTPTCAQVTSTPQHLETISNRLILPSPSPFLGYIYYTHFSIPPILQPYSTSLIIFNSVSLPLAPTLPLVRTYVAITLPPFVITGMFTLFPLAYSYFSAWRKWKSVWALRSDSLRVLINPLGVISCVEVSFLTSTVDLFCLWNIIALKSTWRHTTNSISRKNNKSELRMPSVANHKELQFMEETWNGTAEGRAKKKDGGQRNLIESRSGRLVTPSNQTWCHSHLISNLWRGS